MSARRVSRCSVRRCVRIARFVGLCKPHAKQRADEAFSVFIRKRDDRCVASGKHKGANQCAHIFSRRYLAIRWEPQNAVALCGKHHMYYTHRLLEWMEWAEAYLGRGVYSGLWQRALSGEQPDLAEVLRRLEQAQQQPSGAKGKGRSGPA